MDQDENEVEMKFVIVCISLYFSSFLGDVIVC